MAATKMGYDLLNDPFLNKGTAFSLEERRKYKEQFRPALLEHRKTLQVLH